MLNMWGMGRFVYWNVKYYLFCRKFVPVSKGNASPSWFFFLVLRSITFCMSSLLFDWYSNALSVCLVLVVKLPRRHLMFCWLLPNHLAYETQSECAHFYFFLRVFYFHWWLQPFFCLMLSSSSSPFLSRANVALSRSSNRRVLSLLVYSDCSSAL